MCNAIELEIKKNELEELKIEELVKKVKMPNFTIGDAELIFEKFCAELLEIYKINFKQDEIPYTDYLKRIDFFKIRYNNVLK